MHNEADPSIEKTLITTKLGKLTQYQRFLKILQANTLEDFTSDFKTSGTAATRADKRVTKHKRDSMIYPNHV